MMVSSHVVGYPIYNSVNEWDIPQSPLGGKGSGEVECVYSMLSVSSRKITNKVHKFVSSSSPQKDFRCFCLTSGVFFPPSERRELPYGNPKSQLRARGFHSISFTLW